MIFSASLCASLAFATVVEILSCWKREVTRFRNRWLRCPEVRESLRKAWPFIKRVERGR
jgi:hypothetical protein